MEQQLTRRFRVAADFYPTERDALDALCIADYRPAPEQLRWLVIQEAQRRGLIPLDDNRPGLDRQASTGAIVSTN